MISKYLYKVTLSIFTAILVVFLPIMYCAFPSGGGSEAGNAKIVGKVVDSQGVPVKNALVKVRISSFDPVKDSGIINPSVATTGSDGIYRITVEKGQNYTVDAQLPANNTYALVTEVLAKDSENTVVQCTLNAPGVMKIKIPESADRERGYFYIPGTPVFALLKNASDFVFLKNVPAGVIPSVSYSSKASQNISTIRHDVAIHSGDTAVIYNPLWKYSRQLSINTTASGADVSGNVLNFPLCIRLTSENFKFDQANSDGSDIRIANMNNELLPYEIERWDAVNQQAEIWVKIDTVFGNDDKHNLTLYWGNPAAASESNSTAVFDTSNNFQGVWHMTGNGTQTLFDATANHYNGTPYGMTINDAVKGAIGSARSFNGATSYIVMPNTASGKLDMPQNGTYSISLWVYTESIDTLWHAIAGKGHEQYYLKFKCFGGDKATWEFVEFQDQKGWATAEDSIPPAPGVKQWLYLTGVRSGLNQYLYINGTMVSDSVHLMTGTYARNSGDDFFIGRHARQVTIPNNEGWCYFQGIIDEVRVMNSAPSADWIKLSYMNQKAEDALVKFR